MAEQKTQQKEEKATAASYIINFFTDSEQLRHTLAQYINVTAELKATYGNDLEKIEDNHKEILKQAAQYFRYYASMVYVQYMSIAQTVPRLKDKDTEVKIKNLYEKIRDNFVINLNEAEEYTQYINVILIKNIMKDLLESSNEIIDNMTREISINE